MKTINQVSSGDEIAVIKKAAIRKKRRKQRDPKRHSRTSQNFVAVCNEIETPADREGLLDHDAGYVTETPAHLENGSKYQGACDNLNGNGLENTIGNSRLPEQLPMDEHSEFDGQRLSPSNFFQTDLSNEQEEDNDQALDLSKRSHDIGVTSIPSHDTFVYRPSDLPTTSKRTPDCQREPSADENSRKRKSPPSIGWQHKIFKANESHVTEIKMKSESIQKHPQLLTHLTSTNDDPFFRDQVDKMRLINDKNHKKISSPTGSASHTPERALAVGKKTFADREVNNNASNLRSTESPKNPDQDINGGGTVPHQFPVGIPQKGLNRSRRIVANARERNRVHTISAAFEGLRRAVPCYSHNQKLSKLAILRIACSYILALAKLADLDYSPEEESLSFSDCVDLCTMTLQAEGRSKRKKNQE